MNKVLLISCLIFIQFGCKERENINSLNKTNLITVQEEKLEKERSTIFKEAILNETTIQDFVVVKVLNKNTGKTKEVATFGNFLKGAIHLEYNIDYSEQGVKKVNEFLLKSKGRNIALSNNEALNNIGFNSYSEKELRLFGKRVEEGKYNYQNNIEMTMLAHILFNKGIKSSENNCFGGKLIYQAD